MGAVAPHGNRSSADRGGVLSKGTKGELSSRPARAVLSNVAATNHTWRLNTDWERGQSKPRGAANY